MEEPWELEASTVHEARARWPHLGWRIIEIEEEPDSDIVIYGEHRE